jgi:NADH-quinone oxidoreductase subunit L
MFLALGVGAWSGAVFHLMTHAFFKALLFLSAGAVIIACHHEQDIFKMGGLRRKLPLVYACFLVGGGALAALPFITAGFYSKDEILWEAFASGHMGLLFAGLLGAFLTSVYTFRMIFIVFHGAEQTHAHELKGISYSLPLVVLLVLSTGIGALIHPPLAGVLPESAGAAGGEAKHQLELLSGAIAIAGIALAAFLYLGKRTLVTAVAANPLARLLGNWWRNAWGFDWLYEWLFVKPFVLIANINRRDGFDQVVGLVPKLAKLGHGVLGATENGRLRWYAATIGLGAVLVLAAALFV